jgi:hypothetical protein
MERERERFFLTNFRDFGKMTAAGRRRLSPVTEP